MLGDSFSEGVHDVTQEAARIVDGPEGDSPMPSSFDDVPPEEESEGRNQGRNQGSCGTETPALSFQWFGDVEAVTNVRDFVEGVLTDGAMSVVYGESNSGKTFFASDIGMRVALGWDWQGHEIDPGPVLYFACEDGFGIRNRVAAFRHHHGVEAAAPFAVVPTSVNLKDPDGDCENVKATAQAIEGQTGDKVRLVIIDTLSRALAGGEENSSQDMGALVSTVDAIRQETGAHVMLIHHSGKDTAKGARGHSLLRAATDTEVEVIRPDEGETASAVVKKQRDLPTDGLFSFTLRSVSLGTDRRGNSVTSCVVEPADAPNTKKTKGENLTPEQRAFFDVVRAAIGDEGEQTAPFPDMGAVTAVRRDRLRNQLIGHGFLPEDLSRDQLRSRSQSYLNKLKGKGILGVSRDYVWIP